MYDAINASTSRNLRKLSGEQLLLLAVLGAASLKPKIDRELDRRANASRTTQPQAANHAAAYCGFAA